MALSGHLRRHAGSRSCRGRPRLGGSRVSAYGCGHVGQGHREGPGPERSAWGRRPLGRATRQSLEYLRRLLDALPRPHLPAHAAGAPCHGPCCGLRLPLAGVGSSHGPYLPRA
eukprot:3164284-Alexandrium_andersonii.AAC.1